MYRYIEIWNSWYTHYTKGIQKKVWDLFESVSQNFIYDHDVLQCIFEATGHQILAVMPLENFGKLKK